MTEQKVIEIIAEHFNIDKSALSAETDLVREIHADSLDLVELIMAFEETFDLSIPDDAALGVRTIGDIVKCIDSMK